jgi:hypothetical protein
MVVVLGQMSHLRKVPKISIMAPIYYLHVCSSGEIDPQTKVVDKSIHPIVLDDVGLELSDWPADDLFQTWPIFFTTSRLAAKIAHEKFSSIDLHKVGRVVADFNFKAFYPDFNPGEYYQLNIKGEIGKDDFALYNRMYLVVSEKALGFLRDNHVIHADADEITVPYDEYFNSERKNFWLELERKKLIEKGLVVSTFGPSEC